MAIVIGVEGNMSLNFKTTIVCTCTNQFNFLLLESGSMHAIGCTFPSVLIVLCTYAYKYICE